MPLVFGIGNPGPEYLFTRHNVGFMVVDLLAGGRLPGIRGLRAEGAATRRGGREVLLVKPLTYVNRCGPVLERLRAARSVPLDEILVVVDDLNLPPGRLRLRGGGADGGHNGLKSIAESLGTDAFPRLRIGIGDPGGRPAEDYVLEPIPEAERPRLRETLERAVAAVDSWLARGLGEAMARVNRRDLDQPETPA